MIEIEIKTDLDQWILEATETIEVAARNAIAITAKDAAEILKNSFAANLKLTREAVRYRANGNAAKIGLQFPTRFGGNDTRTHKRFRTQWKRLRPRFRQLLQNHLIAELRKR